MKPTKHPQTGPELELITRRPSVRRSFPPLLFIHGAYAAAWCWDEHFLPYFADRGFEAHALSLRGHGESKGKYQLHWTRMSDYVADVSRTMDTLDQTPILIGHSMGAMVVQKYLERHQLPGAVLMAPVPPQGLFPANCGLAMRDPMLHQQISMVSFGGGGFLAVDAVRRALFRPETPRRQIHRYLRHIQPESLSAMADMVWVDLPHNGSPIHTPVMVMGGLEDAFFGASMIEATAHIYHAQAQLIPGMPHAMMLDQDWQVAADRIIDWFETTF